MKWQTIINKLVALVEDRLSSREVVFSSVLLLLSLTGFIFLFKDYILKYVSVERIKDVGVINEGLVGTVKTLNPFVPQTQNEKDLAQLVFSGLVKSNATAAPTLDLAQKIVISEDGLSFTASLSPYATFHDGTKIKADDVIFSFEGISSTKPGFDLVSISKVDDQNIVFKLEKPNSNFYQSLDFPVVKKGVALIFQKGFVGSGPFKVTNVETKNENEISKVSLQSYKRKDLPSPHVQNYNLTFYQSEEGLISALNKNELDLAAGIRGNLLPSISNKNISLATSSMSSNFVIFINQTKDNPLQIKSLRKYISEKINRQEIVNEVFGGYAMPKTSLFGEVTSSLVALDDLRKDRISLVDDNLSFEVKEKDENKATSTPLVFTLTTLETPELVATAEVIKRQLQASGIAIHIKTISKDELQSFLQSKDYDLFLFGFHTPSPDAYYNFFHSSQISYPKLNIANYANKKVDSALENLRVELQEKQTVNEESLKMVSENISEDMPVIFLYTSQFVLVYNKDLKIKISQNMQSIDERYQFVTDWYRKTERVFSWFQDNSLITYLESLKF